MRITLDNSDCSGALDGSVAPVIERKINQPSTFRCGLVGGRGFVVPVAGARIVVAKSDGTLLFTGYLTQAPLYEYLGWGEQGSVYRYELVAESDEILLDQKALPNRAPYVARSAGSAVRQLAQDLLPGGFDVSGVQDMDVMAAHAVNPQKTFSYQAGEIASMARGHYRAMDGALTLDPVGMVTHTIAERDPNFSPAGLQLVSPRVEINDVTMIGLVEPQAYVRDYFVGDGMSLRFYLSQRPFQQSHRALVDEQYRGSALDPATWSVEDPAGAISVSGQALRVSGGTGQDGKTLITFIEQIELGGALELQHGEASFTGASQGVIGGLYAGSISAGGCLCGFQVTPSGAGSRIQAIVNGAASGAVVSTAAGHRYALTTYLYSIEAYRSGEAYHGAANPAGQAVGGRMVPADVRIVLELQDIDPAVPASLVSPATVLYDDLIPNAPGFCTYVLVNATNMQCSIDSTYLTHISTALVRSALPDTAYTTRLVESLSDGGECYIASSTTLDFYPQYVPPLNTLIVASYRGAGRAVAEVADDSGITALKNGIDDGVRSVVRTLKAPSARTQADCENAALALLGDAAVPAWAGSYESWSDFLGGDVFPGDAVDVDVPSQDAAFTAIVRKVSIAMVDPTNDRGRYTIEFANDLAEPLALQEDTSGTAVPLQDLPVRLSTTDVGGYYLPSLTNAQITQVSSTTANVDAGVTLTNGLAIEVRAHDFGWGIGNDRNLLGRFSTSTFSLPRLARSQNYFLRLYDSSSPPRYSRYAAALHVDYPL